MIQDRYELVEPVGAGGMATVWRATDTVLGRSVAIKRLLPHLASDPAAAERFKREAQAAANLSHPGIVTVFDTGEDDEGAYIILELVEGASLADKMAAEGPFDPPAVGHVVQRAAEALDYAHSQGVVHRDIKPSNLMVDRDGEVRLTDFGIARTPDDPTTLSDGEGLVGTITYMAPELLDGERATPASDIYSLGAVTYEMLAGSPPFQGGNIGELVTAIRDGEPPSLRGVAPDGMAAAVTRAMSRDPTRRHETASAFAAGLISDTTLPLDEAAVAATPIQTSSGGDDPTLVMETTAGEPARKHGRRWGWVVVALAAAVVAFGMANIGDGSDPLAAGPAVATSTTSTATTTTTTTTTATTTTTVPEETSESLAAEIEETLAGLHPSEFRQKDVKEIEKSLDDLMKHWQEGEDEKLEEDFEDIFEDVEELRESPERQQLLDMITRLAELMGVEPPD